MQESIREILKPQYMIWGIVILILLFSKFGVGLKYLSVVDIIKNHLNCFKNVRGKWLLIPIINYTILPFLMGAGTAIIKKIDSDAINVITVIVSILTAMLFTLLTMVLEMRLKIKDDSQYSDLEAKISKNALLETYYTIMFEILVSVVLLLFCFFNCFTKIFGNIQSFIIYSLTYMLVINLLMIIKRVFKVVDNDMKKE